MGRSYLDHVKLIINDDSEVKFSNTSCFISCIIKLMKKMQYPSNTSSTSSTSKLIWLLLPCILIYSHQLISTIIDTFCYEQKATKTFHIQ
jgi:hypothetical protein